MAEPINEQLKQINQAIIEDYYESGLSVAMLCKKYGRSSALVNRVIKLDKVQNGPRERKKRPVDPRCFEGKRALSLRHAYIGLLVTKFMNDHDNLGPSAFGMLDDLCMSRYIVKNIQIGAHDLTLTEIEALAKVLGTSSDALLNPPSSFLHKPMVTYEKRTNHGR